MILNETPRRIMVTKLVAWGHWFALFNIIVALVIASVYVFSSPMPETFIGIVFLFTNWFSHVGFLTFFGFVIFVLPICYLLPKAKLVKIASSTIAATGLALLAFDALLYTKYGLHLSFSSADLIKTETQTVIEDFGWQQWGYLLMLFVVWLSFQLILANALWQRIERFQRFKVAKPITSFFIVCFVSSHAMHVWADANLYQPIIYQDDMFPLSYPATAKTLMSRYGLLDIQSYKQRRELQFDSSIGGIAYPSSPVYCGIDSSKSIIVLVQTDDTPWTSGNSFGLSNHSDHYDLSSNNSAAALSILFGLPEIYLPALANKTPLMLELPMNLGLPVTLYQNQQFNHSSVSSFATSWDTFRSQLSNDEPKLAIAFVSKEQLNEIADQSLFSNNRVLITKMLSNREALTSVPFSSNMDLKDGLSSHLDIAPTVLNALGCAANVDSYSIGQNLLAPRRSWLVGTNGSKIIVLHNGFRIEVLGNGSHKIYDRETGEEDSESLNTGLLSQAIKHLSRFTR